MAGEPWPVERLPDGPAGDVVRRSIAFAAGGWEGWEARRSVEYRKRTTTLAPDGSVERERVELHRYLLHPGPRMRIEYEDGEGRRVVLVNDGDEAWKLVDGEVATSQEDRDHAWNSTFGSHYVFSMPFKLTDPGTNLSYEGRVTLPNGAEAEAVLATYEPWAGSAGGMHEWTYFFDPGDARLVAYHLKHGDGSGDYTWGEYLDYETVGAVTMTTRRLGYASNAAGERLRKTTEINYEDVRFDVDLADELFAGPEPWRSPPAGL